MAQRERSPIRRRRALISLAYPVGLCRRSPRTQMREPGLATGVLGEEDVENLEDLDGLAPVRARQAGGVLAWKQGLGVDRLSRRAVGLFRLEDRNRVNGLPPDSPNF